MPAVKPTKTATPPLAAYADELGLLEKELALAMAPFEMKLPRIKALKELLQEACPVAGDKEWIVEGARFGVKLGPRADFRIVSVMKLIKAIGQKAFNAFATVSLKELESHPAISADILATVIHKERVGPRKLSTFEKGA